MGRTWRIPISASVVAVSLAALLAFAGLPAAGQGADRAGDRSEASTKSRIFGTNGCGSLDAKPGRITFACADAGLFAGHLDWRHWGNRKAKGDGTLYAKVCVPYCVGGYFERFPVTVVLRQIKTRNCDGRRVRMYTRYKLNLPDGEPDNIARYRRGPMTAFC